MHTQQPELGILLEWRGSCKLRQFAYLLIYFCDVLDVPCHVCGLKVLQPVSAEDQWEHWDFRGKIIPSLPYSQSHDPVVLMSIRKLILERERTEAGCCRGCFFFLYIYRQKSLYALWESISLGY